MSCVRSLKRRNPYVHLDKTCLEDPRLTFRAKGLHAYLLSKPDNWRVYLKEIAQHTKEQYTALSTAMDELLRHHYAIRYQVRQPDGKIAGYETVVFETPDDAASYAEFYDLELPKSSQNPKSENLNSGTLDSESLDSTDQHLLNNDLTKEGSNQEMKEQNIYAGDEDFPKHEEKLNTTPPPTLQADAERVLVHLNTVTGRRFIDIANILKLLRNKKLAATAEQCMLVIDWLWQVRRKTFPGMEEYINVSTPFRPGNFDNYRAQALRWQDDAYTDGDGAHTDDVMSAYRGIEARRITHV